MDVFCQKCGRKLPITVTTFPQSWYCGKCFDEKPKLFVPILLSEQKPEESKVETH